MDNKDVAIIGLGPSGVSAAIYLKRYGMNPICYERELVGGKVNKTEKIENYAGIPSVSGPDLGMKLEEQLDKFSIRPIYQDVKSVKRNEDGSFTVATSKQTRDFRYVILANGLGEKPFPIEGEDKFKKRGISRCAICDGSFYQGKDVAVVGAGNAAFEEASYLSDICSHVTLIARRKEFRAQESAVEEFKNRKNTTILAPYHIVSADGKDSISSIRVQNNETGEESELLIFGLFLYVGEEATSSFVEIPEVKDDKGIILTDNSMETSVSHLYAIGDCRNTTLRQVVTATSDGAIAATSIHDDYQKNTMK